MCALRVNKRLTFLPPTLRVYLEKKKKKKETTRSKCIPAPRRFECVRKRVCVQVRETKKRFGTLLLNKVTQRVNKRPERGRCFRKLLRVCV